MGWMALRCDEPDFRVDWSNRTFLTVILRSHLSFTNAAPKSLRPKEPDWVEPEESLIMNERYNLSIAIDICYMRA